MPSSFAIAAHVPPRSTITVIKTGTAPNSRTASTASKILVPRVTVSSVMMTRSPTCKAPAIRPFMPWSFSSLRTLKLRRDIPLVAATAAIPYATGSAPIVRPPIACTSLGKSSKAASATASAPSGRHIVCFVSRNHVLLRPDFKVKSPRLTACARTCSRSLVRAGSRGGNAPTSVMFPTVPIG